jgi:cysteine-rich repeat protein
VCTHAYIGCGDGERDMDEECDDGNYVDGDGCSSACERYPNEFLSSFFIEI